MVEARLARLPLSGLPPSCRPADEGDGYRIQRAVHARLSDGPLPCYKLGATTPVMQEFLGTSWPCIGGLPAGATQDGAGEFQLADHVRPGVECELAVILGRDLPAGPDRVGVEAAAAAVASCLVAIEVVDNRYTDFAALGTPTLIADDFFAAGCVLGPAVTDFDPRELRNVTGRLVVDGREAGRGVGHDVLGDPLVALGWLADTMAAQGRPLRAGAILLLGSLMPAIWLTGPASVEAVAEPLGRVSARFT